jgi:uncharacterized protein with GYD domain
MSKYAVFFTLKAEAIARAMQQPSDRVAVVSKAVESAGGKLEAHYLMFGQYDGFVIVDLPDSRAAAASSLAVSSTGAFEHLETHELIEAEDLNPILEQAKGITSQLPAPNLRGPRRAGRYRGGSWLGRRSGSGCTQISCRSGSGTAPSPPAVGLLARARGVDPSL